MLVGLSIRDVVLIDRLDLTLEPGLGVLTGETGAGKSILLDSLGLALGARADSGLVRHGCRQGTVTAAFSLPPNHPAHAVLAEQGRDGEEDGSLVVRRVVNADGRSRAYVNDQPASVGLLRALGRTLVEIHGQFESHGLLDAETHRTVLDLHGGLTQQATAVGEAWRAWRAARKAHAEAEQALAAAQAEEDWLRHAVAELEQLAPEPDEEETLGEARQRLQHAERIGRALEAARQDLTGPADVDRALRGAQRHLERVAEVAGPAAASALAALERAGLELAEALSELDRAAGNLDHDPLALERLDDRLMALRDAARKHRVTVADLPALSARLSAQLAALDHGGTHLTALAADAQATRTAYLEQARALSAARAEAAAALDAAVARELPPLKLDRARFVTDVAAADEESQWGAHGLDRVAFRVATNPGRPPGPLDKVASGGELARFMLALKVILARTSAVETLVFDEVDTGIGGATAHAVGERLARLGEDVQVLVVTHSPQVAARGRHHLKVSKAVVDDQVSTTVIPLDPAARQEEIARMLAGDSITDEARAAARRLLAGESGEKA